MYKNEYFLNKSKISKMRPALFGVKKIKITLSITLPIFDIEPCRSLCLSEYFLTNSLICSLHCCT